MASDGKSNDKSKHPKKSTKSKHSEQANLPSLAAFLRGRSGTITDKFKVMKDLISKDEDEVPLDDEKDTVEQPLPRNFLMNDLVYGFGVYLEYWQKRKRNTVIPKYKTLREELTQNKHDTITEEQYDELAVKCNEILKQKPFLSANIGAANQHCGIKAGMQMTVEHAICVKLYTDFDEIQREFKRHCRRLHKDEPLHSVMARNAEIAHWCRLLKECVMFWGDTMGPKQVIYSGMNARLVFHSLYQRFECPLSTTSKKVVADQFANGRSGIRLALKRTSPSTKYLNVAPFSCYRNEKEYLIMGSTLKIVDIYVGTKSFKNEIAALLLLEMMIKGRFLDGHTKRTRDCLLKFLQKLTVIWSLEVSKSKRLLQFLEEEQYDSDAIQDDVNRDSTADVVESSNLCRFIGGDAKLKHILERIKVSEDVDISGNMKYIWELFIKCMTGTQMAKVWVNAGELNKPAMSQIKQILFGHGGSVDRGLIPLQEVTWITQHQWNITGIEYEKLSAQKMPITSPTFEYVISETSARNRADVVKFRFKMGRAQNENNNNEDLTIFVEMINMPPHMKRLQIEMDMKCIKIKKKKDSDKKKETVLFRQWLQPRKLSNPFQGPIVEDQDVLLSKKKKNKIKKQYPVKNVKGKKRSETQIRGFRCFDAAVLRKKMSLKWVFGVKVFNPIAKSDEHSTSPLSQSASNVFSEMNPNTPVLYGGSSTIASYSATMYPRYSAATAKKLKMASLKLKKSVSAGSPLAKSISAGGTSNSMEATTDGEDVMIEQQNE